MSEYFRQLFINDTPLLDVRAGTEYEKGAFPTATNIPVLNNQERHDVGVIYNKHGPASAEALGHRLVSGAVRQQRLQQWIRFIEENQNTHLYCFRGGKRSGIVCEWLNEAGFRVPRIDGGYKAMRSFLLNQFTTLPSLLMVSGHTGVGKTEFLNNFTGSIDLEGLANHRGSAFGKRLQGQPAQIDFENALAIEIIKRISKDQLPVVLEDEGRLIGRIMIPNNVKAAMDTSPVVVLTEDRNSRVERILRDYILSQYDDLETLYGAEAIRYLGKQLLTATDAIRKRLGGVTHKNVRKLVSQALSQHELGKPDAHRSWISVLLEVYYDPMYSYQLRQKQERIVFQGSREAILDWYTVNNSFPDPTPVH